MLWAKVANGGGGGYFGPLARTGGGKNFRTLGEGTSCHRQTRIEPLYTGYRQ